MPFQLLAAGPLTVKGSDTMVILAQRWAEAFMRKERSARIQVTGGGTGTGLAALQNGTTDIAMASRAIKEDERHRVRVQRRQEVNEVAVAKDGVAFYVREGNPVTALRPDQLRSVYQGDVTNWRELGGRDGTIVLYSRESSSGTYLFVKEKLLGGEDFAPAAQTLPGTAAVVNAVAQETHGIGYGGAAYAKGVRELKIKAGGAEVAPSLEAVKSGQYPLSRDLYFYTRGTPSAEVQAFMRFCLSDEGQRLAQSVGFYPVR
ncbi:MAG TPA: phosphate ABC transporter substrate-binding protein [Myxococcaceae bacterium]|nr:phosphate ABC transporter substrate-binding protein [Myxococcaceae bacterium]